VPDSEKRRTRPPAGKKPLNVYIDVDHTILLSTANELHLRPGTREAVARLKAAGHRVYIWSASGASHCHRVVELHGLGEWVDGCFDKDPAVEPPPDLIIDDDWYLVEKYGGFAVRPFRSLDPKDDELLRVLEELESLGHL
jgi:phosphoglycolate phosphatase-like HAD superfamily hydrolase